MSRPTPQHNDRFEDYVPVAERLEKFYERFPDGRVGFQSSRIKKLLLSALNMLVAKCRNKNLQISTKYPALVSVTL